MNLFLIQTEKPGYPLWNFNFRKCLKYKFTPEFLFLDLKSEDACKVAKEASSKAQAKAKKGFYFIYFYKIIKIIQMRARSK